MQVTTPHEPRRAGLRALRMAAVIVSAFGLAAFSFGWHNSTIRFLGYVALIAMLFLFKAIAVRSRRGAAAGAGQPGAPESANCRYRRMRTVGICVALLGLVLFGIGIAGRRWAVVGWGLLVVMVGTLLVQVSLDHAESATGDRTVDKASRGGLRRFDRAMRTMGIVLVPLAAFSFGSLYLDAIHGYHEGWPLYLFFAVALASVVVWPYLFARAFGRWLGH